jgi:hypothetical protein
MVVDGGAIDPPKSGPADKPLRFPCNVFKLLSNNLELIPK